MIRENGHARPTTSFSEEKNTEGIDTKPETTSVGCPYETPDGPCRDSGTRYQLGSFNLELCDEHLEAVIEENDLQPLEPRSPKALAGRAGA